MNDRDEFAKAATVGIMGHWMGVCEDAKIANMSPERLVAMHAYDIADELMAEKKRRDSMERLP